MPFKVSTLHPLSVANRRRRVLQVPDMTQRVHHTARETGLSKDSYGMLLFCYTLCMVGGRAFTFCC